MGTIENLINLSRSLMKVYIEDGFGPLPSRPVTEKVKRICSGLASDIHSRPRVMVLYGLRGVGKTTLMFQTMKHLIDTGVPEDDIIYFSMDRATFSGSSIRDIVSDFERTIIRDNLVSTGRPLFFFIDEAHYSYNWDLQIKTLTDEAPNVVLIVSGSSALSMNLSPDLSRRSYSLNIPPLNYLEHLRVKERKVPLNIDDINLVPKLVLSEDADEAFKVYEREIQDVRKQLRDLRGHAPGALERYVLEGGLPSSFGTLDPFERIYDTVRRIIERDVPLMGDHDTGTLRSIPRLIGMLAHSPDISMSSLSRDIEGMSITTVRNVLDTLRKAGLLFEIELLGGIRKTLRADTRKYFSSSCLAASIIRSMGREPSQYMGALVETSAASIIYRGSPPACALRYHRGRGMADLVIAHNSGNTSVEIGLGKKDKGVLQIRRTMRETSSKYGILICGTHGPEVKDNVLSLPLRVFLCL